MRDTMTQWLAGHPEALEEVERGAAADPPGASSPSRSKAYAGCSTTLQEHFRASHGRSTDPDG